MNTTQWTLFFEERFDKAYQNTTGTQTLLAAMKRDFYRTFPYFKGDYSTVEAFLKVWAWNIKKVDLNQ